MLATEVSNTSRGILNHECAVLPPSRRSAAIPDDATHKAIFSCERTAAAIVLQTNVFPPPPALCIVGI